MNEQEALWRFAGVIVVIAVWGYCNFSNHPDIVKARNTTQKWINTGIALFFIWLLIGQ
jgi:low affinity Fe/Cu permease